MPKQWTRLSNWLADGNTTEKCDKDYFPSNDDIGDRNIKFKFKIKIVIKNELFKIRCWKLKEKFSNLKGTSLEFMETKQNFHKELIKIGYQSNLLTTYLQAE